MQFSNGGETLLHIACRIGSIEMVSMLLAHGASVTDPDAENHLPTHVAGWQAKLEHSSFCTIAEPGLGLLMQMGKTQPKSKGKKEKELDRMRREMDERLSAEQAKRGRTETEEPNVEHPEAEMEKEETDHRQKEPSGDQFESEELEKEEQDQPPAESQNLGDQIERERLEKEEWDRAHREAQNRQKADDETLSRAQRKLRAQQASADAISGIAEPQRAPQHTNPKTKKQQNLKSEKGAAKAPSGGHINGSNNTTVHNVNSKGETATSRALASAPVPDFSASESGFEVPRSSSSSPDDLSSMIFEADVAGLVSMGFSARIAMKLKHRFHRPSMCPRLRIFRFMITQPPTSTNTLLYLR
ncbi:hypothetical protein M427DRAFT_196713 [Gonapodya prolifera JEL478]|uniref:Uncharacterized protein n=1 Tax=Gonapodya prolifera (strain JEL478) TaxID=1344416 RepID=A0A139APG4_GONPJ|nr:hypothetical protein M427DRAFT_196713 [Gonapodya prolifera JEL478]|eukprot:KXS18651.1 hypothetical protein M427DRAFT_196713 [Gonapodya prolifera JEL478]